MIRKRDVRHVARGAASLDRKHPLDGRHPREHLEGQRLHERGGALRQDRLHLGPVEGEQARQVYRFIRGDAARYAEDGFLPAEGGLRLFVHGESTSPRWFRIIFLSS